MASSSNEVEHEDQNSAAGEVVASNPDLTTKILLLLPARSVANSKYVSKQWLSIISDPEFIRSYTLHHYPRPPSGFFIHYVVGRQTLACKYVRFHQQADYPSPFVKSQNSLGLNILQSCNGLLLCSVSDTEYYVCNPTTLQRKQLDVPKGGLSYAVFGLNLAFDPKKSSHYKVVSIRRCSLFGQKKYQLEVYSSETGQWKTSGEPFVEPDVIDIKRGVFCKGAIHWVKKSSNCLYFDVVNESMRSTPEPPPEKRYPDHSHEYFCQSNGHLYLVVKRPLPNYSIFEMDGDYSGWFMKYVVDLDGLSTKFPSVAMNFINTLPFFQPHYGCNVLSIWGGRDGSNEEEGIKIVPSVPGEIVTFDPQTNASKKIVDLLLKPPDASVRYRDYIAHEYFETLFSV